MDKALVFLSVILAAAISFPIAATARPAGFALLHPINGSSIQGLLAFVDSGTKLRVGGVGTGFDPSQTYVSLFYDVGSTPRGSSACLPTDNSLTFAQMVGNFWQVRLTNGGVSIGTLEASKTGDSYAPLDAIGTVSIRLDTQPGQPLPSAPDPSRFVLQACGKVR